MIASLADAWNSQCPPQYALDPADVDRLLIQSPYLVALSGDSIVKSGAHADVCHLSLIGMDCDLPRLLEELGQRGWRKVIFGADRDHVLPGCPTEYMELTLKLQKAGFVTGPQVVDLEADLRALELPAALSEVKVARPDDTAQMEVFLDRCFPGRWRSDVGRKMMQEPDEIDLLWLDGEVAGFSMTQSPQSSYPISGAVWRSHLGEDWRALGPIGLAPEWRGKGLGGDLLRSSLARMKAEGGRRCLIDWTTLVDFYGKYGFKVTRRYQMMSHPA